MADKRNTARKKVSLPAVIQSGHSQAQCTILDVSSTGARVRLSGCAFLANECTIQSSLFLDAVPSRIIWRRGTEIGLRFRAAAIQRKAEKAGPWSAPAAVGGWFGRRK